MTSSDLTRKTSLSASGSAREPIESLGDARRLAGEDEPWGPGLDPSLQVLAREVLKLLRPHDRSHGMLRLPRLIEDEIEALLARELNAPLRKIFEDFSFEPKRRDETTQTHRARLRDGGFVDVTLLIPDLPSDASELLTVAQRHSFFHHLFKTHRSDSGRALSHEQTTRLLEEGSIRLIHGSDMRRQARGLLDAAKDPLLKGRVEPPRVYPHLCARRVLIHGAVEGPDLQSLLVARPHVPADGGPVRHWVGTWLFLTLFARRLPRDPSPQNVTLTPTGRIALFRGGGSELSRRDQDLLWRYLEAVVDDDPERAFDVLVDRIPELSDGGADRRQFRRLTHRLRESSQHGRASLGALLGRHHRFITDRISILPEPLNDFFPAVVALHQTISETASEHDVIREALEVLIIHKSLGDLKTRFQWPHLSEDLARALGTWTELPLDLDAFLNLTSSCPATGPPAWGQSRREQPLVGAQQALGLVLVLSSLVFQLLIQIPTISESADRVGAVVLLVLGALFWLQPSEGSRDYEE